MAEIYTDEGLDAMIEASVGGVPMPDPLYLGLFTSQSPTTVPDRTATGGAAPSGWTEVTGAGYARLAVSAASWGAPETNGGGRRRVGARQTFTAGGAWGAANGSFLATKANSQALDVIVFFANFDSGVSRTLTVAGDILRVTPRQQMDG